MNEHVCLLQRSTPPNVLFIKDDLLELGSDRVPLMCVKQFWSLSNAASFIILIIVLNLVDDQWEELRVSIPTVPCCCAEMITAPRNALLNVQHIGTRDWCSADGWQRMDNSSQFIWLTSEKKKKKKEKKKWLMVMVQICASTVLTSTEPVLKKVSLVGNNFLIYVNILCIYVK